MYGEALRTQTLNQIGQLPFKATSFQLINHKKIGCFVHGQLV